MGIRLSVRSSWAKDETEIVYEFDQARIIVGRAAGADVHLPHPTVSTTHTSFQVKGSGYTVVDESSTNGTWIGEHRVVPGRAKVVRTGDVVTIGGFFVRIEAGVAIAAPTGADRTAALARRLIREAIEPDKRAAPATLTVLNGPTEGDQLALPPPPARLIIGRGEDCDLVLPDADASREHVEITVDLDGVLAHDLSSKNGILVAGARAQELRLVDRDELLIGNTMLVFEDPAVERLAEMVGEQDLVAAPPRLLPLEPVVETPPESVLDSVADEPAPAPREPPTPKGAAADLVILVLAAAVLAISLLALFMLFGAQ